MPAPLIAAGAVAARGGAAVTRGAAGAARGGARLVRGTTRTKKASSLLKKIASLRVVWIAALFDFWQCILGLILIPVMGYTEAADAFAALSASLAGSVQIAIAALLAFAGGQAAVSVGIVAGLGLWAVMTICIVVGYFACGLAFVLQDTKLVGEKHAGVKLPLLIICLTFDFVFPIGGLFPGLTLWALYLAFNPE